MNYGWKLGLKDEENMEQKIKKIKMEMFKEQQMQKNKERIEKRIKKSIGKMMNDENYRKMYYSFKQSHGLNNQMAAVLNQSPQRLSSTYSYVNNMGSTTHNIQSRFDFRQSCENIVSSNRIYPNELARILNENF